jgi:hypothetical protein
MADLEIAPNLGSQWAEDRGNELTLGKNPNKQADDAKVFLNYLAKLEELGRSDPKRAQAALYLRLVLKCYVDDYPEFLHAKYPVDDDIGSEIYRADPDLLGSIHKVITTPDQVV